MGGWARMPDPFVVGFAAGIIAAYLVRTAVGAIRDRLGARVNEGPVSERPPLGAGRGQNPIMARREAYKAQALRMGRPKRPCACGDCECPLHAYRAIPGPGVCIWCRHGQHHEEVRADA